MEKQHNVLPDSLKNHSMAKSRQYINYDVKQDITVYPNGFLIPTPSGGSFLAPSYFNDQHDPFSDIEKTTMDEGDILVSSPIKTGSHWMFEIVSMLTRGSANYDPLPREAAWIDIQPLQRVMDTLPKPRILGTHIPLGWLPTNFRRPDTKVVMMMRNLKDVIVSSYHHHLQKLPAPYDKRDEFHKAFLQLLYTRYNPFGNHLEVYADIWDNYRDDPNVLIVMYEDLKKNGEEVIRRVSEHLGLTSSPELISHISEAVHITKLKPAKYDSEAMLRNKFGDKFSLFRRGQVGEWKSWFTIDMDREFHKIVDEWNKDRQIPFIYEI